MGKRFPVGWFNYSPIKEVLVDARLVPFKCPLPVHCFQGDNMRFRWSPSDVMEYLPNLGLVIDLTFKQPSYYDPMEFQSYGVAYKKIMCMGHVTPSDSVYQEFCDTIEFFMIQNANNDRIVGVHCTHGVNRTGYFVCRFLVEKLGYIPQDALNVFAMCRGHRVERENYIEVISNLI